MLAQRVACCSHQSDRRIRVAISHQSDCCIRVGISYQSDCYSRVFILLFTWAMLYYQSSTVCRLTRETGILSKNAFSLSFTDGNGDKCLRCGALFSYARMDGTLCVPYIFIIYLCKSIRTNVSMHQTNSSKSLKICGVVFCGNIFYFSRNYFFSFDRSNMQIFTVKITRVV